jgi:hypothetical protein
MRILVHSNAPWAGSGYGGQTAILAKHLPEFGHQVVVSAMNGLDGRPLDWDGTLVLPSGMRSYSNDVLAPTRAGCSATARASCWPSMTRGRSTRRRCASSPQRCGRRSSRTRCRRPT